MTADAGALCLKSGNAVILRGGSESFHSSRAVVACMHNGLAQAGLPLDAIQLVPTTDRAAVGEMLTMTRWIDILVPRGGASLVERVQRESRVPVIAHLMGLCHVFVDHQADPMMARDLVVNAKLRRTSICGAAETLLLDRRLPDDTTSMIVTALIDAGCEVRGDKAVQALVDRVIPAADNDWDTEHLDAVISARLVDDVDDALAHICRHGSDHTDCIVTGNTPGRPSISWPAPPAPLRCGMPPPSSPMAESSAWARKSAFPPTVCTRAGPWASNSSRP